MNAKELAEKLREFRPRMSDPQLDNIDRAQSSKAYWTTLDSNLYTILAALEAYEPWVSVKERLPEKWDEYLVNIRNHRTEIAMFSSMWCLDGSDGAGLEDDITHWRPLPAPKEEE